MSRIGLVAPDLARWASGNAGVDHVWRFDAGVPGPTVMVQALTHGNEICGAIVLDWLLQQLTTPAGRPTIEPAAGRLIVAFGNMAAHARWDPAAPHGSRHVDEDFNRVWSDALLDGLDDSVERRRARALRPFVRSADLLLDIHSMTEPCRPIMVCGTARGGGEKAAALARRLGVPGDLMIDTGHPSGRRMIEYGHFGAPDDPRTALLIECGQHWEAASVPVAFDTLLRFLRLSGVLPAGIADDLVASHGLPPVPSQRLIRVTEAVVATTPDFEFLGEFRGLEVIAKAGDPIARDGNRIIRAPYDDTVLVMPSSAQTAVGTTMVRLGRVSR